MWEPANHVCCVKYSSMHFVTFLYSIFKFCFRIWWMSKFGNDSTSLVRQYISLILYVQWSNVIRNLEWCKSLVEFNMQQLLKHSIYRGKNSVNFSVCWCHESLYGNFQMPSFLNDYFYYETSCNLSEVLVTRCSWHGLIITMDRLYSDKLFD